MIKRAGRRKSLSSKIDENIYETFDQYCKEVGQSKRVALERILVDYLEGYYDQDEEKRRPL